MCFCATRRDLRWLTETLHKSSRLFDFRHELRGLRPTLSSVLCNEGPRPINLDRLCVCLLLSTPVNKATRWKQSRHHRRCQLVGSQPRAPASAQVTTGPGITVPTRTDGWCSAAHRRQQTASRHHGRPMSYIAEYSVPKNTPPHVRGQTLAAKLLVALSMFCSRNK